MPDKMVSSVERNTSFTFQYIVLRQFYALIDQLWGPHGKIFGPQFWSTEWGPYEKLRSEYFYVWTELIG